MLKRIALFMLWVVTAAVIIVMVFVLARWMIDATSAPPTTTRP